MSNINALIYGGGPFYSGGSTVIADLKASDFTSVVAWALHVNSNGDLIFNSPTIVTNGDYVGDPGWPAQLNDLKQGGSVTQLLFSVGGWGVSDFPNIQKLIQTQGTGPDSILYKNFSALKQALPVDAIDFDDETLYDQDTTVQFSQMLAELGYHVTFCPYTNIDFWVNCLYALNSETPDLVTAFNLQCYAGGSYNRNNLQPWIDAIQDKMGSGFEAAGFINPGLWCRNGSGCVSGDCPDSVESQFAIYKSQGIKGGFIWLYDDLQKCENSGACSGTMGSKAYADAIISGLS